MIEKLREWRARPEPELSIGPLISERANYAKRAQKRLGSFVDLWEGVMPGELACHLGGHWPNRVPVVPRNGPEQFGTVTPKAHGFERAISVLSFFCWH